MAGSEAKLARGKIVDRIINFTKARKSVHVDDRGRGGKNPHLNQFPFAAPLMLGSAEDSPLWASMQGIGVPGQATNGGFRAEALRLMHHHPPRSSVLPFSLAEWPNDTLV